MYAEDVNYWQTGKTSPDSWIEKAKKEIRTVEGQVVGSGSFSEDITGRAGFMLSFRLEGENFTIKWPVLRSKSGNHQAAQRQAATALYHEVKAACVKVKFLGARSAFFAYLMLPDGRTASEAGSPELLEMLPGLIGGNSQPLIEAGI
jgi:hypothetical protein